MTRHKLEKPGVLFYVFLVFFTIAVGLVGGYLDYLWIQWASK